MQNRDVDVYIKEEYLLTAKAGKKGLIKVRKNNNVGKLILNALQKGDKVRLIV
jgi:predicted PilT family ATPase